MSMSMNQDNSEFSYVQPYSTNSGRSDSIMDNYRTGSYRKNDPMSQFKQMFNSYRSKRQATDSLDLDASNNLDLQAMKRDAQQYAMPSPWFGKKYEMILDSCYEMASNLPAEMADNSVVSGSFGTVKLAEIKMFLKCEERGEMKLCMNQDIKTKVESNFGPMEEILQQTQLTEAEFFPLVMQLLHGEEMDYMFGSM